MQNLKFLLEILKSTVDLKDPDFTITHGGDAYLRRWYLRRDENRASIYLHHVVRDDLDRALHDHPWDSCSIILSGGLREILPNNEQRILMPGSITCRNAEDLHRLELLNGLAWTLFITGAKFREWGFQSQDGWMGWEEFLTIYEGREVANNAF